MASLSPYYRTFKDFLVYVGAIAAFFYCSVALPEKLGKVLRVEVQGKLDRETRIVLSRILSPDSAEAFLDKGTSRLIPLEDLCEGNRCGNASAKEYVGLDDPHYRSNDDGYSSDSNNEKFKINQFPTVQDRSPWFTGPKSYLIVRSDSPVAQGYEDSKNGELQAARLSQSRLESAVSQGKLSFESAVGTSGDYSYGRVGFAIERGPEIDQLESDLAYSEVVTRQYRIPSGVTEEEINQLLAAAAERENLSLSLDPDFSNDFVLPDSAVVFQADEETCEPNDPNWPFSADSVGKVIERNLSYLSNRGIINFNRAVILIVDTGLGKALSQSPRFQPFIDVDLSEALHPKYYYRKQVFTVDNRICSDTDLDNNSFGLGFSPSDLTTAGGYVHECRTKNDLERVSPLTDLASQTWYNRDHGSFVAVMAAGGPDLSFKNPQFAELIGLRFARITKRSTNSLGIPTVRTEVEDLRAALNYATAKGIDIVNLSLKVENRNLSRSLVRALNDYRGLAIAAAGNTPIVLSSGSELFPAGLSQDQHSKLLVVAASARDSNGEIILWPESARSSEYVHIAAPGDRIESLDHLGNRVCMSGTSAAAPVVSFTAAMLKAFGIARIPELRHRILLTSTQEPRLEPYVVDGRSLNVVAALDLYVDQIWLSGQRLPSRGLLVRKDADRDKPVMLKVCRSDEHPLDSTRGVIDLTRLMSWEKLDSEEASIWHRSGSGYSQDSCAYNGETRFHFFDLTTSSVRELEFSDLDRIVPSPLRDGTNEFW